MARRNSILVSKTLYQVGVITLIASILWTSISLMQAITKNPTKIEVDKRILEPLNIAVDKNTLELVSARKKIELNFEQPIPSPTSTNPSSASESASDTIDTGGQ
mgnify:CR=1 FL=1